MIKCRIDGKQITTRDELHKVISEGLNFPQWYGKNLDALHDCLTDLAEEAIIEIADFDDMKAALGDYADSLAQVIKDSAEENRKIHFMLLQ